MIEFKGVSKVYQSGTEALNNINLKVEKGEFVFIVGSSGAGKSTFLKLIMCEEKPNKGQVIVAGINVTNIKKHKIPFVRRKMGIVFQDFRLINHMSVYDNVAFAMRVVGASNRIIKKRVPYILSLVGLQHKAKHKPTELSGGERQRVGLARALVNNPSLIIADEPTGNIDPALSFEIVDLLNEINRRGTTILMVTHEHSLVKHFHKRIIQIHGGEIVADTAAANNSQYISREEAQHTYEKEQELVSEQDVKQYAETKKTVVRNEPEPINQEPEEFNYESAAVIDELTSEESYSETELDLDDDGDDFYDEELFSEDYDFSDDEFSYEEFVIEEGEEDRG